MRRNINEEQLRNLIKGYVSKTLKESYNYTPEEDAQEGVKYFVDMTWYHEDGRKCGDMGYTFDDEQDAYFTDFKDCIDNIRESFENPEEYDTDYIRSKENPTPMVATIIRCVGDLKPTEGEEVYTIANCGEDVAKQYGIQADEYIETIGKSYDTPSQKDWDNIMFNDDEEEPELTNSEMDNYYNKQNNLNNSMKRNINEAGFAPEDNYYQQLTKGETPQGKPQDMFSKMNSKNPYEKVSTNNSQDNFNGPALTPVFQNASAKAKKFDAEKAYITPIQDFINANKLANLGTPDGIIGKNTSGVIINILKHYIKLKNMVDNTRQEVSANMVSTPNTSLPTGMAQANTTPGLAQRSTNLAESKQSINEAQLRKMVAESVKRIIKESEGVNPEELCDKIMAYAGQDMGEEAAESYRPSCLALCRNFLAKHSEITSNEDAYNQIIEEPTPERSRYMKLFHFRDWKQNATVEDLVKYKYTKTKDMEKCQAWAEAEYEKMHGGESAPAGLEEAVRGALKEYFDMDTILNPGNVKNEKVKDAGYHAQFNYPGTKFRNDTSHEVWKKNNGGKDKSFGGLKDTFSNFVFMKDMESMEKFANAVEHNNELYSAIRDAICNIQNRAQKERMNRGAAEE